MRAVTVRPLDHKDRRGIATPDVSDEQLIAHFSRLQKAFLSLVRDQDIDPDVKNCTRAR